MLEELVVELGIVLFKGQLVVCVRKSSKHKLI
jgi:hypothetical protein